MKPANGDLSASGTAPGHGHPDAANGPQNRKEAARLRYRKSPETPHWHVWHISPDTLRAAFMSRPYTSKSAADTFIRRAGPSMRPLLFVRKCDLGKDCPRPPRVEVER